MSNYNYLLVTFLKNSELLQEFYGKWTGDKHNLVCQKCLEKKE